MEPAYRRLSRAERPPRPVDEYRVRPQSYVYVIKCREFYKIGKADEVESRIKDLQIGCPYKLELLHKFELESPAKACQLEAELHRVFYKKNGIGEWFKLTLNEIEELKSYINNISRSE